MVPTLSHFWVKKIHLKFECSDLNLNSTTKSQKISFLAKLVIKLVTLTFKSYVVGQMKKISL